MTTNMKYLTNDSRDTKKQDHENEKMDQESTQVFTTNDIRQFVNEIILNAENKLKKISTNYSHENVDIIEEVSTSQLALDTKNGTSDKMIQTSLKRNQDLNEIRMEKETSKTKASISLSENISQSSNLFRRENDVGINQIIWPATKKESFKFHDVERKTNFCSLCCCKSNKSVKNKLTLSYIRKSFLKSKYSHLRFYKNHLSEIIIVFVFILIHIILAVIQLNIYRDTTIEIRIARVNGIWLNLDCSLIMLLVMRRLVSFVRNSIIGPYLPVDNFIQFHKILGELILTFSLIHTIGQCIATYFTSREYQLSIKISNQNDTLSRTTNEDEYVSYAELLFTTKLGTGWVYGTAAPTGWALLVVLLILVIFSLPVIRSKGYFQVFYFTHWSHPFFFILLFIHAGNFWKWFLGPLVIVLIERIYNWYRHKSVNYGKTFIKDVNLFTSKVTHLIMIRPPNFKYKAGDYLFLKVPIIAKYEWHPFTISSAPQISNEVWLHVRSLGSWTKKLHQHFDELSNEKNDKRSFFNRFRDTNNRESISSIQQIQAERRVSKLSNMKYEKFVVNDSESNIDIEANGKSSNSQHDNEKQNDSIKKHSLNISKHLKNVYVDVYIDGPYSTVSRKILLDSEQAILIAAGIGVTPFASILQSLWFKHLDNLRTCSNCDFQWYDQFDHKKLKQVDFIWVNRDYQAFEWFIELLSEIEFQQLNSDRFIRIHLYMTSSKSVEEIMPLNYPKLDKKIQMKSKTENFSLKLNPGRPDISQIFAKIAADKKGKIDVFYCGNLEFGKLVHKKSLDFKFKFYKEYF